MAKRRSTKMIPPDYSIGKNVFPVVPFRKFIDAVSVIDTSSATIVAGNVREEIELDLDFESNEVFDVLAIQAEINIFLSINATTNPSLIRTILALTDDPDKAAGTPIETNDVFEGDESFVWYMHSAKQTPTAVDLSAVNVPTDRQYFIFEQPWTVARNMAWIASQFSTAAGDASVQYRIAMWGRRRNASDDEFKSIIYRQRF